MEEDKKDDGSLFWAVAIVGLAFLIIAGIGMHNEHQNRCEEGYERVHVGNTSGCISYEKILEEIQ